jgi:hypothetical protein
MPASPSLGSTGTRNSMRRLSREQLIAFLSADTKVPGSLRLVDCTDKMAVLEGDFRICAQQEGHILVDETLRLRIEVDNRFPEVLPTVIDCNGVLPRSIDNHVYSDGAFCLGSELVLKYKIQHDPTVGTFLYECVEPFLYSVFHFVRQGTFPYGELAHGVPGLIADYEEFFGVRGKENVLIALSLLTQRKRVANKRWCPCMCGRRLGRCALHIKLNRMRKMASRSWYSIYYHYMASRA